jgi:hypothetical protein
MPSLWIVEREIHTWNLRLKNDGTVGADAADADLMGVLGKVKAACHI